jgi:hypothetical protein
LKIMKLLSTLAVVGAMKELTAVYYALTGVEIEAEFAPTAHCSTGSGSVLLPSETPPS